MAVYKPTLCYPFLNGVDARVAVHDDASITPYQQLSCQIDTSNKNVTGYKIRLLTEDNIQVFPVDSNGEPCEGVISPISELQQELLNATFNGINSGINGTTLCVPFFQNYYKRVLDSYNSIYYTAQCLADYVIFDSVNDPVVHPEYLRGVTVFESGQDWLFDGADRLVFDWEHAQITQEEYLTNTITLDGDVLTEGRIILIVGNNLSTKKGLWKVTGEPVPGDPTGSTKRTVLARLTANSGYTDLETGADVTILRGKSFHNLTWRYVNDGTNSFVFQEDGAQWLDYEGTPINFTVNSSTFKWEVTLYQGNYITVPTDPPYITYNNLDPEWLDMTLTTGTILGSTPERIQIGLPADYDHPENYIDMTLPKGTTTNPLVLQGKYVQLLDQNRTPINNRVYVKTYDATLGHAYPLVDKTIIDTPEIERAVWCEFYKLSNNSEDILATDIVDYCFTEEVNISYYKYASGIMTQYYSEDQWIKEVSLNNRKLVIDNHGLRETTRILLTGQSEAKQNGVYTLYKMSAQDSLTLTTETYYYIERAASYTDWSAYIQKYIYCSDGDIATVTQQNVECLAQAGTYTLWNPLVSMSGDSPLIFVPERPIMLNYESVEKTQFTYMLTDVVHTTRIGGIAPRWEISPQHDEDILDIDRGIVAVGDKIVFGVDSVGVAGDYSTGNTITKGNVVKVTGINYSENQSDRTYTVVLDQVLSNGEIFKILNGRTYGDTILQWDQSLPAQQMIYKDLYRAVVLKNTDQYTLITPWKNIDKHMKLELNNNNKVYHYDQYNRQIAFDSWITITDFNTEVFCIKHDPISTQLVNLSISSGVPLSSYPDPWLYSLKTFYRTSDENPFYSYETPYIRLYKNGFPYSDLALGNNLQYYGLAAPQAGQIYGVANDPDRANWLWAYLVSAYANQLRITGHSAHFAAEYMYYGNSSWESYSWFLYDDNNNLIQQSGRQYDHLIEIYLYGLANDTTEDKVYYLMLELEDDTHNVYEYVIPLIVAPPEAAPAPLQLDVTPDCSTCSNILKISGLWADDTQIAQSYSIFRREYEVYCRPEHSVEGYLHDNKFYYDTTFLQPIRMLPNTLYIAINNNYYAYEYDSSLAEPLYMVPHAKIFKGNWEPVLIKKQVGSEAVEYYRDFGIENQKSYQYILYPDDQSTFIKGIDRLEQIFANYEGLIWYPTDEDQGYFYGGSRETSMYSGAPVLSNWDYWSIVELIPEPDTQLDRTIPVNARYRVNDENAWLFKYNLDTGTQTQNISRDEFATLAKYNQFALGNSNAFSGDVSVLLGSEIVPMSDTRYIERLGKSRVMPLSTNEKAYMLKKWHDFVYSKNPKLLKDIKGQSWIVHIISGSNSVQNWTPYQPDTISFQWKQIGENKNTIMYGEYNPDGVQGKIKETYGKAAWVPAYRSHMKPMPEPPPPVPTETEYLLTADNENPYFMTVAESGFDPYIPFTVQGSGSN